MTTEEYNALIARLIGGLPASLVISRLTLALHWVVQDTGEQGAAALRQAVELKEAADARLEAAIAKQAARDKPRG